ncbi:hypothetical protein [Flavobacterium sp.]|uniref:hypothetical protein n=1 Tax=Flavobacterium sp. TaxID=239 RepID=UPI0039E480A9
METNGIIQNERTAEEIKISSQPDGPGLRMGKRGELTMIGNLTPGGAELFRKRLPQFQAESNYWETRVGTVQNFRIVIFDNDTRYILTVVYDGDFEPYVRDIGQFAGPWLDAVATGVLEDYPGSTNPGMIKFVKDRLLPAEFFWAANSEVTVRDIIKMQKLHKSFGEVLDAMS